MVLIKKGRSEIISVLGDVVLNDSKSKEILDAAKKENTKSSNQKSEN